VQKQVIQIVHQRKSNERNVKGGKHRAPEAVNFPDHQALQSRSSFLPQIPLGPITLISTGYLTDSISPSLLNPLRYTRLRSGPLIGKFSVNTKARESCSTLCFGLWNY